MAEADFAWFAGIDWSSERHQACLVDVQGSIVAEREFAHNGTGLAELGDWLLSTAGRHMPLRKRSKCRTDRLSIRWLIAASSCMRSTPSSSTACVTGSVLPVRRILKVISHSAVVVRQPAIFDTVEKYA